MKNDIEEIYKKSAGKNTIGVSAPQYILQD
jgi:hypothetical protein